MKQDQILILVGPSGAGKSTFLAQAIKDYPQFQDTVTYTTRPMRKGEKEGDPYHFVSVERFQDLIKESFFVEWARVHDKFYGTPAHQLEDIWSEGNIVIMDVDVQGAKTFKSKFPQALTIFILPPSIDSLRQRITKREGKVPEDIEVRMRSAKVEMDQAEDFDFQLVNEDFSQAYAQLRKMIEENLKFK